VENPPHKRRWLVLGATAALGRAFCDEAGQMHDQVICVSRNPPATNHGRFAADILKAADRQKIVSALLPGPSGIFFGHGLYVSQQDDVSAGLMRNTINKAPADMLSNIAGHITNGADIKVIAIGSAAAHWPTPRNPAYAHAKAAWEVTVRRTIAELSSEGWDGNITLSVPGYLASRNGKERRKGIKRLMPAQLPTELAKRLYEGSRMSVAFIQPSPIWNCLISTLDALAEMGIFTTPYHDLKARRHAQP